MQPAYLINGDSVVVVMDGKHYVASDTSHSNISKIIETIKLGHWHKLPELFDMKKAIVQFTEGLVSIVDGILHYNNEPMNNTVASRIMDMYAGGFDIKPMARFLQNLMKNPSYSAIQELYLFLETGKMPITDDGHFLAYKKVRNDYKDIYTGTMDNSVGKTVKMHRHDVDDNRNNTCSNGLHFCSIDYLGNYGSNNASKVVIVKIDPSHVVSIPSDYKNTKGRCSEYVVIGEYKDYRYDQVEIFNKPVYDHTEMKDQFGWDDPASKILREFDELTDLVEELKQEIYDIQQEVVDLEDKISELESVTDMITTESLLNALIEEIEKHRDNITLLEQRESELDDEIEDLEFEMDELEKEFLEE